MKASSLRILSVLLLLYFSQGCSSESPISFALDVGRFHDKIASAEKSMAFDLVSSDMDLDGDPDLLINWHHKARLELYENRNTYFYLSNPKENDRSGLFENASIPDLYADSRHMAQRITASGEPGVYVWHELNRKGSWHFFVKPDKTISITLEANQPILSMSIARSSGSPSDEYSANVTIQEETHFTVQVKRIATQLMIHANGPLFIGATSKKIASGQISLWKDDPHGIAWVDALGTKEPDIYIARGGLVGELLPPHDPKTNRFFIYSASPFLYQLSSEILPSDYGRGRQLNWVDIDGNGTNELYLGNSLTPNGCLSLNGQGRYQDIAPSMGIDFVEGDTFCWLDINRNGFDDLIYVTPKGLMVARNNAGKTFDLIAGKDIGLVLPLTAVGTAPKVFDSLSLHVLDFNNDGLLDIWLNGFDTTLPHALYRAEGTRFVDVTREVGLQEAAFARSLFPFDIDNDGYIDAVSIGEKPQILLNQKGRSFYIKPFYPEWRLSPFAKACVADIDSDGRTDLVIVDNRRLVALNTSANKNTSLTVDVSDTPRPPIGAVVSAIYGDGLVQAQRFGSAHNTQYSQGLQPLSFGAPFANPIRELQVAWPGGSTKSVPISQDTSHVKISP